MVLASRSLFAAATLDPTRTGAPRVAPAPWATVQEIQPTPPNLCAGMNNKRSWGEGLNSEEDWLGSNAGLNLRRTWGVSPSLELDLVALACFQSRAVLIWNNKASYET